MKIIKKIREELVRFGFRPNLDKEIEDLEGQFTICQLVVVVLSMISVVFLFVPLFYLQDIRFVIGFSITSLIILIIGIWFWLKRHEICENPGEYDK